ncbi:hypothetical protein COU37_01315 [Candidatus Micrarchaeota archaeon CG10_big_fil_rev_8_21_14_0_10_45_29]|nr:MAG: hypothetical protein COU37_01315 [Candidatus Micrarchaeota archaeon CG10_big_fil_rev_8_21_14_0_10_45_29]
MPKKKSSRGSLVKEISKPLPGDILENFWLKDEIKTLLRKYSGIYGLYKDDELYYVGLANNLHKRVKDHIKDRHAKKWDRFKLIIIKKVKYVKDLEALVLSLHKPTGNKRNSRVPSSYHINRFIRNIIKSNEKYLSDLERKHKQDIRINKEIRSELVDLRNAIR